MVYDEVGKLPLQVTTDKRLMSFWLLLCNKEDSSLAHIVYMIAHNVFVRDVYKAKWLCRVKNIVDNNYCGLSYLLLNQSMIHINQILFICVFITLYRPVAYVNLKQTDLLCYNYIRIRISLCMQYKVPVQTTS